MALYADGRILLRYSNLSGVSNQCTVGIQNASPIDALQMTHNANYLTNSMAIEFRQNAEFFTASTASGSIQARTLTTLSGNFKSLTLPSGMHAASVSISDNEPGSTAQILSVQLEVKDHLSDVAITTPTAGYAILQRNYLNVSATASSPDGVEKVEFYAGAIKIGESSTTPYSASCFTNELPTGINQIYARATNVYGFANDSAPVSFTILADSDIDGMADDWEIANGLNPQTNDSLEDADSDGYTNLEEYQNSTNPHVPDNTTDNDQDGMWDRWELRYGLSITANDSGADLDHDGLTNLAEFQQHTFPNKAALNNKLPNCLDKLNSLAMVWACRFNKWCRGSMISI